MSAQKPVIKAMPLPGHDDISSYEQILGDRFVNAGRLSAVDLERARRLQSENDEGLAKILVKSGLVSEQDAAAALAGLLGLALTSPDDYPDLPLMEDSFSARFLKHKQVIPVSTQGDELIISIADPFDHYIIEAVCMSSGKTVNCQVGLPSEIDAAIERLYGAGKSQMDQIVESVSAVEDQETQADIDHLKDLASEAPVIRLVNLVIERAVQERASDIHIEPFENHLKVRYRVDGVLHEVEAPPQQFSAAVISRIKIMAKLDIAERRLPQDGRMRLRVQGKDIDLRISTVPTLHGESLVIRLLYKDGAVLDFETLGFSKQLLKRFSKAINRPYGIILVTGPTGSGKTTTLYAALNQLNDATQKILTVEDPVEYQLTGINQIQVKPQIDLTFARALRSIVRQDPDIIMIGEMRDQETARIAVQSALTGHLVLSTLHTNNAASSITRMLDMGIEDYLVTSAVYGVLAQRLLRKLCQHCCQSYEALPELVETTGLGKLTTEEPVILYKAAGCEHCRGTGYQGRTAIMEMLSLSDAIRKLILSHADAATIAEQARSEGMQTLYEDGLTKALAGITSIEEVLRVTQES